MDLIICEKRSVGISTAKALSTSFKEEMGYIVCNNNIIVTWCIGHLFTLAVPKAYKPEWEKWSWSNLPMIPEKFKLEIIDEPRIKIQAGVIKKLASGGNISRIILNTDSASEGQLIGLYIVQMLGLYKKPCYRMWVSSMSNKALQEAYKNLISWNEPAQQNLALSAFERAKSDWLIGLNLTRMMTLWGQDAGVNNSGGNNTLTIGRVQTVSLAMVYDREQERTKFSKRPFYPLKGHFQQGNTQYFGYLKSEKEFDKAVVENIIKQLKELPATVTKYEKTEKLTQAPLLFDLASCIAAASKRFGMKAPLIQENLNNLYLKSLITYARTDSSFLTENEIPLMHESFDLLKNKFPHLIKGDNADKKYVTTDNKRICRPEKVSDHHAIIVEPKIPTGLNEDEQKLYELVLERCFMHFHPPFKYSNTSIDTKMGEHLFVSTYNETVDLGWKALLPANQKEQEKEEVSADITLIGSPTVIEGEAALIGETIEEKVTSPPAAYTDASLILAMSNVSTIVKDPIMKEKLKERGIGTSATRSAMVEKLLKVGYLTWDKKKLTITKKGAFIIESLRKSNIKVLTSPEMTAQWEIELENIRKGKSPATLQKAILNFVNVAHTEIKQIPSDNVQLVEYVGECPLCKSGLTRTDKRINCSGNKNGCEFFLWSNQYKKAISDKMLEQLLTKGKTNVLSFKNKDNKPYKAQLLLEHPVDQGRLKIAFADSK